MSSQHDIVDDTKPQVTDLVALQEQLDKAKQDLKDANEILVTERLEHTRQLASSHDANHQELTKLREELSQSALKLIEQEKKFELGLETKLTEKEEELSEKWAERTVELRQERDELRQDALQSKLQNVTKLHEFNVAWSRSLTAILANTINDQEISFDLLHLPVLPQPVPLMHGYSFTTAAYAFAEIYTGLASDVTSVTRDQFRMIELLCWTNNMSVPFDIPADTLGQIVWLETNLLENIRTRQTRDSWVLLAFGLLSKMVLTNSWPACCIAAIRLALLKRQYLPYDTAVWDDFVADLIKKYAQLDIDPLGQTCMAYLCLTTSDPQATMSPTLPGALSQARFDMSVRVPELLAMLRSPDVASADRNGTLGVVIVRHNQHQDVAFSRIQNSANWSFSLQPLEVSPGPDDMNTITWGPGPEQSIAVARGSDVWSYINRHHSTTLIAQINDYTWNYINAMLEKYRRR